MIGCFITSRNEVFVLLCSMVSGVLVWLLTGFPMLLFFINTALLEFQVGILALFLHFSVIDGFRSFRMVSLSKKMYLILVFLKAPFLVPCFLYYILMIFLRMLSVKLLSMLVILCSFLSMIGRLIFGSSYS